MRHLVAATILVAALACNSCVGLAIDPLIDPKITLGSEFAHRIHIPTSFRFPTTHSGFRPTVYGFRLASPAKLVITACGDDKDGLRSFEVCSTNAFSVDTAGAYRVEETQDTQWQNLPRIGGFEEIYLHRWEYGEYYPKEFDVHHLGRPPRYRGFQFRGKDYLLREANTAGSFNASQDGDLVMLSGYDRSKLSHGPFTIDVFAGSPSQRVMAFDAISRFGVEDRIALCSIVNSRWFVIGLSFMSMQDFWLFDFKPGA